ncbi:MAG: FeoA domain-containing protein [Acidobacteriota bacterium]|jgi:Fe2+ transport system protein FeoA|nr:FeoA domain-containing protein [Acidobacteriota bacterium]
MSHIDLLHAPIDREVVVIDILAGPYPRRRLISMGIHPGDRLIKYKSANWGPVLVRNVTLNATRIAIGRGLAQKIIVSP